MRQWIRQHGQAIAFLIMAAVVALALNSAIRSDANKLYQAQIEACHRGNALRTENNSRIGSHQINNDVLIKFLKAARVARLASYRQFYRSADLTAARHYLRYARLLEAKVEFHSVPLVNCKRAIPKP